MTQQRNIFTTGLGLVLRHWPALVWTYVFNLGLAFVFTLPLHNQIAAITDHSLAAQRLASGFDLGTLLNVSSKLSEGPGAATGSSFLSIAIYVGLYFLLVPGTLFCYQTNSPARLATLLQTGLHFFWRLVRVTLISFVSFALALGPLLAINTAWQKHVDENITGRAATLHNLAGLIVIGLVAAALRVYFDLVEVYTVALGQQLRPHKSTGELVPERRVRRAFGPALRAYGSRFISLYFTFVLLTLAGLSAVILTARIAMHTMGQPRMWPAFLLSQIGLFLMLLTRFWQRGAETIVALDSPLVPAVIVIEPAPLEPVPYVP